GPQRRRQQVVPATVRPAAAIAAASIAQAYRARLRSGEQVVVKIQRPGIAEAVDRDTDALDQLTRMIEDRTSWGREYRVRDLAAEFAERLRGELDFRAEARNADGIRAGLAPDSRIRIPTCTRSTPAHGYR